MQHGALYELDCFNVSCRKDSAEMIQKHLAYNSVLRTFKRRFFFTSQFALRLEYTRFLQRKSLRRHTYNLKLVVTKWLGVRNLDASISASYHGASIPNLQLHFSWNQLL
jgi:hypothetical protein